MKLKNAFYPIENGMKCVPLEKNVSKRFQHLGKCVSHFVSCIFYAMGDVNSSHMRIRVNSILLTYVCQCIIELHVLHINIQRIFHSWMPLLFYSNYMNVIKEITDKQEKFPLNSVEKNFSVTKNKTNSLQKEKTTAMVFD